MTAEDSQTESEAPSSVEDPGATELKSLLRGALHDDVIASREMLPGVQRKIRQRSRGKFYADGWSTAKHAPISTYLITSLFMLALVAAAYSVLGQLSGDATRTQNIPAPVQVLPPIKNFPPAPTLAPMNPVPPREP